MTSAPAEQLDEPFLSAASLCSSLLATDEVARLWDEPSSLPRLSVGALACHLGRQITRSAELLEQPSELPILSSALDHYARAAWVTSTSLDDPSNDRSVDDAEAALGHAHLLQRVAEARDTVATQLRAGTALPSISIPWQGWALRRDDFLLTRNLEIVVHTTDLSTSLGIATPAFPDCVFDPVRDLLVTLSQRRHGQTAIIDALARSERAGDISAF